jgi:hypothetical protein
VITVVVSDKSANKQSSNPDQSAEQGALVQKFQSESNHLRRQVDHLTQVVAMQTQQQGELEKQLYSPARASTLAWVRLKLQAMGLTR